MPNNSVEESSYLKNRKNSFDEWEKLTEKKRLSMRKEARELSLYWVTTFEEAVWDLLKRKKEWGSWFIDFNWRKLYSIDIENMNDAYLVFYWKTKPQLDMEREKARQEQEADKKRKQLEAIEKIPWLIEESKMYIDESKWWEWENFVNGSARSVYILEDVYDIITILRLIEQWKSWKEIQKKFDEKGLVGFYPSVIRNRIIYYSKKWEDAKKYLKLKE